jgi:hypothetical protein
MTQSIKEGQKPAKKRRTPPVQFVGQVKELGDVITSISVDDWGQIESLSNDEFASIDKNT